MWTQTFKCALVGCGAIAPNHLAALTALDGTELCALCDIKTERAENMRSQYAPSARIYNDLDLMLSQEKLDALHIATPHFLHTEMAIKALERGINVFLEKPVCISREELDLLLRAEARSHAKICVCFQNRYNNTTELALRAAESDGGAISAYASVVWQRDEDYYKSSDWRGKHTSEGGGVLINQAIHSLDLLTLFLGKPKQIYATTANHHLKSVIEVEDTAEGMIVFEGGKKAVFYATTAFFGKDTSNLFIKTKNHDIEIRNSDIFIDNIKQNLDGDSNPQLGKDCYGKGHYGIIKSFYNALASGGDVPVSLESAQWAMRTVLAAYSSSDEKIEV